MTVGDHREAPAVIHALEVDTPAVLVALEWLRV